MKSILFGLGSSAKLRVRSDSKRERQTNHVQKLFLKNGVTLKLGKVNTLRLGKGIPPELREGDPRLRLRKGSQNDHLGKVK